MEVSAETPPNELRDLGFVVPSENQCARAKLSIWSERTVVQSALAFRLPSSFKPRTPHGLWPAGTLRHAWEGNETFPPPASFSFGRGLP